MFQNKNMLNRIGLTSIFTLMLLIFAPMGTSAAAQKEVELTPTGMMEGVGHTENELLNISKEVLTSLGIDPFATSTKIIGASLGAILILALLAFIWNTWREYFVGPKRNLQLRDFFRSRA